MSFGEQGYHDIVLEINNSYPHTREKPTRGSPTNKSSGAPYSGLFIPNFLPKARHVK